MILRYRDLAKDKGHTIAEHKAILEANGAVWWGWWNKQGETVPTQAFIELTGRIAKDGP